MFIVQAKSLNMDAGLFALLFLLLAFFIRVWAEGYWCFSFFGGGQM